jgi:hypothetical protein
MVGLAGKSATWYWAGGRLDGQIRYYLVTMVVKIHAERNVRGDLFDGVAQICPCERKTGVFVQIMMTSATP